MKKSQLSLVHVPEYGLLRWVIDGYIMPTELQLRLIVTGGHLSPEQGLTYRCIEEDGYDIDAKVDMLLSSLCFWYSEIYGDVQYWDERCFSASSA